MRKVLPASSRIRRFLWAAACMALLPAAAVAQNFPSKPVRLIVKITGDQGEAAARPVALGRPR